MIWTQDLKKSKPKWYFWCSEIDMGSNPCHEGTKTKRSFFNENDTRFEPTAPSNKTKVYTYEGNMVWTQHHKCPNSSDIFGVVRLTEVSMYTYEEYMVWTQDLKKSKPKRYFQYSEIDTG